MKEDRWCVDQAEAAVPALPAESTKDIDCTDDGSRSRQQTRNDEERKTPEPSSQKDECR